MESYQLLGMLMILGLLTPLRGVTVPSLTIHSPDGDIIECINIADQPAFDHPLLANHNFQEYPTGMSKEGNEVKKTWQVWHETGEFCPTGTIPLRRELGDANNFYKKHRPITHGVTGTYATMGHKYAIGHMADGQSYYGTRATFNVWDPVVQGAGDFSLAQIWVASGSYEAADMNTIEAGWQVYPARYLDHQPRFFTYWTSDAYNRTGCYGIHCGGFVQTSNIIAIEAAISLTSTYGGTQLDITIQIWKDPVSGNWWLGLGLDVVPVGYWPAAILPLFSDHATRVEWGGEVLYRNITGLNTKAQMGSGEFADKGFEKAAYLCNIKVAKDNHTLLPVRDFNVRATDPKYYTIKKSHNKECGNHFYYGGPGPLRSRGVRQTLASTIRVVFLGLVVCLVFLFLI